MIAATLTYDGAGALRAKLANGEVWRYVDTHDFDNGNARDTAGWIGDTADDYAPVAAEHFASYIASVAAGEIRKTKT